jgi:D-alanine-D-alanine ligase
MKVLLLAGGDSNERDVSLSSSAAFWQALVRLGHDVICYDPSTGHNLTLSGSRLLADDLGTGSEPASSLQIQGSRALDSRIFAALPEAEIVVLGLHGGAGENGSIQNLLDLAGKAYTGSGTTASVVAMDKAVTKHLMRSVGVPTADFQLVRITGDTDIEALAGGIDEKFDYPLIVKPNDGGSTVGLTKVQRYEELGDAIRRASAETGAVLVEQYIAGRELTVAVLDGEALPVVEIRPKSGLYDYEAKYTKGKTEYIALAPIAQETSKAVRQAALSVYEVVGASGLARIDFLLQENGEFFCLELNTLPGMTELSLSPMAAKAAGISFDQLVERIIAAGLRMRRERWKD